MKALQIANNTGQRTYHITQANMTSTLPAINHDSDTLAEIRASLNSGKEVITHTDAVSVPGWSGAGYSVIDPETGDGAYKISGGVNGGFLELYDSIGGISTSLFLTGLLLTLVSSTSLLLPLLGVILFIINIFHVFIKVLQTDLVLKENGCPEAISTMLIWLSGALLTLPRLIRTQIANIVMPFISFTVKNTIGSSAPLCKYHL